VRAPRDASKAELALNPRSSSARLRVVEKIAVEGQK
jgi:16S rRNA C1402 N4-methylase RsmH